MESRIDQATVRRLPTFVVVPCSPLNGHEQDVICAISLIQPSNSNVHLIFYSASNANALIPQHRCSVMLHRVLRLSQYYHVITRTFAPVAAVVVVPRRFATRWLGRNSSYRVHFVLRPQSKRRMLEVTASWRKRFDRDIHVVFIRVWDR